MHVDLQRPEEDIGSPRPGKCVVHPRLCWELNPDPLEEQPVLLTEKASLWPLKHAFMLCVHMDECYEAPVKGRR